MEALTRAEKKNLRSLQTKKGRREQGQFIAEGISLLEESLKSQLKPVRVYYSEALINTRAKGLLRQFRKKKIKTVSLAAQDLAPICDTETSQGLLGLFDIPKYRLDEIIRGRMRVLLLDNISDPGNAGTLIRSAAAFGFEAVVVTNYSVEPYNPKVVRSSAGTIFMLPVISCGVEEVVAVKKSRKMLLLAADIKGAPLRKVLPRIDKKRVMFLAIGSEAAGISKKIDHIADHRIRIGHERRVDSLNAAVAGSIIMKEVYES